jgi:hypothetical protein
MYEFFHPYPPLGDGDRDSGEQGRGDFFIPIPIYDSGDQRSPYPFSNR